MNKTLIYDYNPDGSERPVWLLVDSDESISPSEQKRLYVDVSTYKKEFVGMFMDENIGCSVCMNELLAGRTSNEFCVDIPSLAHRMGDVFENVHRLIILASDISEVMAYSDTL